MKTIIVTKNHLGKATYTIENGRLKTITYNLDPGVVAKNIRSIDLSEDLPKELLK